MPLRLRLALLNAALLAGAIVLLSAIAYAQLGRSLAEALDDSLDAQAKNLAAVYQARAALPPRTRARVIAQPAVFSSPSFLIQVLEPEGAIVERSSGLGNRQLPVNPETLRLAGDGEDVYETLTLDRQHVRIFTMPILAEDEFLGYIQVARSLEGTEQALDFLKSTLVQAGAAVLAVSFAAVWLLAGASLQPIARITQAAREIAHSGRLDRRLPPLRTRDEVTRLAETFNQMMARLEGAFTAQRRFVGDASHELRTPLTTIRGNIEVLRRSGSVREPEMAEALDDMLAESERMSRLADGLLALARADAGQELARARVQLDEVLRSAYRELQPISGEVQLAMDVVEPLDMAGDADALKELLLILVDNGLKYTPAGGTVTIGLKGEDGQAILSVADTGLGIAEDDIPHIFERFYRAPSARAAGGTGLGLAIARWIAEAHHGRIDVVSEPGKGSTFTVRLPVTVDGSEFFLI